MTIAEFPLTPLFYSDMSVSSRSSVGSHSGGLRIFHRGFGGMFFDAGELRLWLEKQQCFVQMYRRSRTDTIFSLRLRPSNLLSAVTFQLGDITNDELDGIPAQF